MIIIKKSRVFILFLQTKVEKSIKMAETKRKRWYFCIGGVVVVCLVVTVLSLPLSECAGCLPPVFCSYDYICVSPSM